MQKTLILAALTCVCNFLFAQDSKFAISAYFSPTLAHRLLDVDDPELEWTRDIWNDIESPKAGYSTGLLAGCAFHKKVSIQTGISFSDNGYLIKKNDLRWGHQFNGTGFDSLIPLNPGEPSAIKFIYRYYFIDIPVQVKYTFFKKGKINLYATAGVEANFNIANKATLISWYGENKEKETNDDLSSRGHSYRKHNCSAVAGIGADITLGSKVNIFIQPTYRQMLLSHGDTSTERRLFSAGLVTGVSLNL